MKKYSLKNFLPLITILLVISLLVTIKQWLVPFWTIDTIMLDVMGIFFIVFGGFKIINLKEFAQAYAMYDVIAKYSRLYALSYPFIEISLGILYMLRWQLFFANALTLFIMLISAVGVANELLKGKDVMCACLGTVFKIPMTYVSLGEDLAMAIMAAIMMFK